MRRKYEYLGQLPNYSKLIFLRLLQQKILDSPINTGEPQDLQLQFYIKIATNL